MTEEERIHLEFYKNSLKGESLYEQEQDRLINEITHTDLGDGVVLTTISTRYPGAELTAKDLRRMSGLEEDNPYADIMKEVKRKVNERRKK